MSALLAALLALSLPAWAEDATLHDDETRLSAALQTRAQEALDGQFGPGRSVVQVRLALGLSDKAQTWVDRLLSPPPIGEDEASGYSWSFMGGAASQPAKAEPEKRDFLLPGYEDEEAPAMRAKAKAALRRQAAAAVDPGLVRAFGTEVQRLAARVTLDAGLGPEAEARARELVREVVGASDARGDVVLVERGRLPGVWTGVMARPSLAAGLAAVGGLLILGLFAAASIVRTAESAQGAMRFAADRIAGARTRSAERSLDLRVGGEAALKGLGATRVEHFGMGGGPLGGLAAAGTPPEEGKPPVFQIAPEHAPKLHHLLKDQAAEHVALVVPFLSAETREALFALMPKDRTAEVLGAAVRVRYVDPVMLKTLQDELERRVEGVVGGVEDAVRLFQTVPEGGRVELLRLMREKDPAAAAALREKVFLLEDLERLSAGDLALFVAAVGIEDLAAACHGFGPRFVEALAAALPRRSAAVFREMLALPANSDPDRTRKAREALVRRAEDLIAEGRIKKPPVSAARASVEMT